MTKTSTEDGERDAILQLLKEAPVKERREIYTTIIIILLVFGPLIFLGFFDV